MHPPVPALAPFVTAAHEVPRETVLAHGRSMRAKVRWQPSTLRWTALLALVEIALCAQLLWAWALDWRWLSLAALWPALSLGLVVLFYLGASMGFNPGPWMKGDRAPWLQPVLLPYKCVAFALTVLMRQVRGPSVAPTKVIDGLWLGMRPFDPEARSLDEHTVHCIVDLCAELGPIARLRRAPFERLEVPTLDRCPPEAREIERAVQWIAARREEGRSVYVHCAFGRGRSAMVCAAALIELGAASDPERAIALLRRARPSVSVRGDQRRALEAWAATR